MPQEKNAKIWIKRKGSVVYRSNGIPDDDECENVDLTSTQGNEGQHNISAKEKQEDREKLNGCKLSRAPMEGEVRGGRDDEVSISSVLSNASPHWIKESKEAKPSSDEDARTLKTDGPDDISTGGVKLKESALEDKKIATIENLNKWGFLR